MTDTNDEWSEVCPWTYLKQMVEGGALEPEILKKLTDENEKLKKENDEWKEVFADYAGGDIGGDLNPEAFADYLRARLKWQYEDEQKLTDEISELEARLEDLAEEKDEEIDVLKETIRKQGDRLAIYTAKEEKPHTPSSAVAHAVLELKNDEIQFLKEEIEKLKLERDQLTCWRTSLQKKVDELEPELADYKRISGKQEKRLQEVFAENEKLCEKDDY